MRPSGFQCDDRSNTKLVPLEGKPGGWIAPHAYSGEYDYFATSRMDKPMSKKPSECQVGGDHYKDFAIQPAEFCQKNHLDHCEANIVKYACRHALKGGKQDVLKIIHYAKLLLEWSYGEVEEGEACPKVQVSDPLADTQALPGINFQRTGVLPREKPAPAM